MGVRSRNAWLMCALLPMAGALVSTQQKNADLDRKLVVAAANGDVATVADLLKRGADVGASNEYGTTPLYYAADQANLPLVKELLEHGADADRRDYYYGKSAMRLAAVPYSGVVEHDTRAEIIRLMLGKGFGSDGEALGDLIRARFIDAALEIIGHGRAYPGYLNLALESAKRAQQQDVTDLLVKAGAKDPSPTDNPRSPERLKLLTGVYRNQGGETLTIAPALHEDELFFERSGAKRVVLLPADLTVLRSADMKTVVLLKPAGPPPAEVTLKEGDRNIVYARVGNAPAVTTDAARQPAVSAPAVSATAARASSAAWTPPPSKEWPSFRGAYSSGIADGTNPPTTWDAEKGTNIKWKTEIPGLAHSSPIIWGNRVFVSTAVPLGQTETTFKHGGGVSGPGGAGASAYTPDNVKHSFRVYALEKNTGKILWERVATEGVPRSSRHVMQSQADSTPATDGSHLAVFFGSEGLYCYDLDGTLLWKRDLGRLSSGRYTDLSYEWKTAASPVIYKNLVILQLDLVKTQHLRAFDINSGRDVWRVDRDEIPSWSTPLVYDGPPRTELVTAGGKFARGYDPDTGKELWRLGGHSDLPTPTPIASRGLIFLTSGNGQTIQPIYALRPGATGDITLKEDQESNDFVIWSKHRGGTFLPTPLVYGDLLYLNSDNGILAAYTAETGERVYQERLVRGGSFSASGVAADGHLYYPSEDGTVVVVKAGPKFEKLAENPMGEVIMASPAVSPGMIVFRMQHHIVAVAESAPTQ